MQAYAERAREIAAGAPELPHVNDKNGGETTWGTWEQTKNEITMYLTLPEGTRAGDCSVRFSSSAIKIAVKGRVLLDDTLSSTVVADECYWEIQKVRDVFRRAANLCFEPNAFCAGIIGYHSRKRTAC